MPKLPEDHPLSAGYGDREARRMRADRLRAEEWQREWLRKWQEERARPIGQRQFFSFAEVADRLTRNPCNLTIGADLRERVRRELVEWVQTQQFVAGEVVALSGDTPNFRPLALPLPLADGGIILLADDDTLALRRNACRRYLEARAELPGAASLLREWFGTEAPEPEAASAPRPGAARPGPRAGEQTSKGLACQIALKILDDKKRRPKRGYGRLIMIARLASPELPHRYADESISKMIRATVRDWEKAHPRK